MAQRNGNGGVIRLAGPNQSGGVMSYNINVAWRQ